MNNLFSRLFHSRDKPTDAVSSAPTFYFGSSASGKAVNPTSAIQVSAVYACVRVIAETIANFEFVELIMIVKKSYFGDFFIAPVTTYTFGLDKTYELKYNQYVLF